MDSLQLLSSYAQCTLINPKEVQCYGSRVGDKLHKLHDMGYFPSISVPDGQWLGSMVFADAVACIKEDVNTVCDDSVLAVQNQQGRVAAKASKSSTIEFDDGEGVEPVQSDLDKVDKYL